MRRPSLPAWQLAALLAALLIKLTHGAAANPFDLPLTQIQNIEMGADYPGELVIDPVDGLGYLATDSAPSRIAVFSLAVPGQPAALLYSINFETGENSADTIVIDNARRALYVGTYTGPAMIIKFRLNEPGTPPTRLGTLTLEPGENFLLGAVFDHVANTAYFGLGTDPGQVAKVHLGDGDALPTRVGTLTLNPGENEARGIGAISPARGKLWLATTGNPLQFVQVSLGAPGSPPTRDSAIEVPFNGPDNPIAHDPLNEAAFVHTYTNPSRIIKFGLAGSEPNHIGDVIFDGPGDQFIDGQTVDPVTGLGFAISSSTPINILRYTTGGRFGGPGRIGVLNVTDPSISSFNAVAYDPATGHLYVGIFDAGDLRLLVFRQEFAAGPDLTGTISNLKVSGKPGKFRAKARLTETNTGSANASFHLVRFFLSDDPILDAADTQLGPDRIVKSLKSGKSRRLAINSPPLTDAPSGKYIFAHIDRNNLSGDVNPGNNVFVSAPLP